MKDTSKLTKTELLDLRRRQLEQLTEDIADIKGYLIRSESRLDTMINAFRPDKKRIKELQHFKKSQESELYLQKCDQDICSTEIKILEMELNDKGLQVLD